MRGFWVKTMQWLRQVRDEDRGMPDFMRAHSEQLGILRVQQNVVWPPSLNRGPILLGPHQSILIPPCVSSQGGGQTYPVTACYMWNLASWDSEC